MVIIKPLKTTYRECWKLKTYMIDRFVKKIPESGDELKYSFLTIFYARCTLASSTSYSTLKDLNNFRNLLGVHIVYWP